MDRISTHDKPAASMHNADVRAQCNIRQIELGADLPHVKDERNRVVIILPEFHSNDARVWL